MNNSWLEKLNCWLKIGLIENSFKLMNHFLVFFVFIFCFFFVFVLDSWLELIAQHQILRCCIVHFHLPHWPHLNFNSNDKTARFDSQFIKQCQCCCYLQFQALIEFVCKLDVVVTSCVTITSCLTWNIKLNNYVLYL